MYFYTEACISNGIGSIVVLFTPVKVLSPILTAISMTFAILALQNIHLSVHEKYRAFVRIGYMLASIGVLMFIVFMLKYWT